MKRYRFCVENQETGKTAAYLHETTIRDVKKRFGMYISKDATKIYRIYRTDMYARSPDKTIGYCPEIFSWANSHLSWDHDLYYDFRHHQ